VQQLTAPWCPGHPSMQCLATFRLSTSPLHRDCYSSQQDELRVRPVRTRIAGQRARPACALAMQSGQRAHRPCRHSGAWVRGCARTHPGGARASCVAQLRAPAVGLPCPPPRPPSQHSCGQLAKILPRGSVQGRCDYTTVLDIEVDP